MRKFFKKYKVPLLIILILSLWRIYFIYIESLKYVFPQRIGYLGFIPQANFDGVYYLTISQYWYRGLDQAFFPLYPITIWAFTNIFVINPSAAGTAVSVLALFFLLLTFYKLLIIDNAKKSPFWVLLLFISFPTSFFLTNIYTESLFIFLILVSFYCARRKHRLAASIVAAFASGTRVVGIFLLPALFLEFYTQLREDKKKMNLRNFISYFSPLIFVPLGLITYMGYLWYKYSDPLLFVHIQPAFGAGRSGGEIILLPQVIYRYIKIFLSVPFTSMTFFVSFLEIISLIAGIIILFLAYKNKIRKSYIVFSFLVLMFPTLSGTLSSLPRYILASFVIFIFLGQLQSKIAKISIITCGFILQAVLAILFLQGYFVS